ncbi:MAG TPA: ABC transporter ATP-binding protein [Dehalococcoidales bacterium]|nr:ABC transporter ATP-binding protein [Dehalococcoidales bacterium]
MTTIVQTNSETQAAASRKEVILRTTNLSKNFGTLKAVDNFSVEISRGEVFGLLGPNGAGKSTIVGMILNLVTPTRGRIEVFGRDLKDNPWSALKKIGAVIESPAFYPYLSGRDNLESLAISIGDISRNRITEVLERVNLLSRAKDKYSNYSMGMKQRLGIASTLLRDPELIILDEPTNGLDPAGMKEIRDLIPQLAHENRAVILCSHLLHEVEQVCTRVAILKKGVTLADASVQELLTNHRMMEIKVDDTEKALKILSGLTWVKSTKIENGYLVLEAPAENASLVNKALAEQGIFASELIQRNSGLEKVFLQLTGGDGRE